MHWQILVIKATAHLHRGGDLLELPISVPVEVYAEVKQHVQRRWRYVRKVDIVRTSLLCLASEAIGTTYTVNDILEEFDTSLGWCGIIARRLAVFVWGNCKASWCRGWLR